MTERPFDARQALLADHTSMPTGSWRTVSLVTAMREFISRDPEGVIPNADDHCAAVKLCADVLTARGVDANCLVRYGLQSRLMASVLAPFLFQLLDPSLTFSEPMTLQETRAREWADVLLVIVTRQGIDIQSLEGKPAGLAETLEAIVPVILLWCEHASLSDLIALKAPELAWLDAQRPLGMEVDVFHQYLWLVDRFSVTSLSEWAETSLHAEYRWAEGGALSPCPPDVMQDRLIAPAALHGEIARRAATPGSPALPSIKASLATRMQAQACSLLRQHKFDSAATLFEFAVAENPSDAGAQNNLGFCLLPRDPDRAWSHLNRARKLDYQPLAINTLNRVLCLALLDDKQGALDLANQEWDLVSIQAASTEAILWRRDPTNGDLTLVERGNPADMLADLALALAHDIGSVQSVSEWESRKAA